MPPKRGQGRGASGTRSGATRSASAGRKPRVLRDVDVDSSPTLCRVRSFTTKTGAVVNKGDSFKVRSRASGGLDVRASGGQGLEPLSSVTESFFGLSCDGDAGQAYSQFTDTPPQRASRTSGDVTSGHGVRTTGGQSRGGRPEQVGNSGSSQSRKSAADGVDVVLPARGCAYPSMTGTTAHAQIASTFGTVTSAEEVVYNVIVLGGHGVGKTTLAHQLLTSEYLANKEFYSTAEEHGEETVTVQLDDEETTVRFHDLPGHEAKDNKLSGDGFLVVYSVTDRNSFRYAQSCLQELRPTKRLNAVILVANKQDVVRNTVIDQSEGIKLATKKHCKFIEVSALLDHQLDELLVGIVRQIRLRHSRRTDDVTDVVIKDSQSDGGRLSKTIGGLFRKIFHKQAGGDEFDCCNLFTP